MDKSIVAVEESPLKHDCLASASKSLVFLVQISSIAIDISCPMEEIEPPQHEHFSIRGFVAGARKKNLKICSPFPSENVNDNLENDLPLLLVPKFRWWHCSHCVPGFTNESAPEMVQINRNDMASATSYGNVGRDKGRLFLQNKKNTGNKEKGDLTSNGNIAEASSSYIREQHDNNSVNTLKRTLTRADGSSGSDGGFVAARLRKKKKLRSLADIMDEQKNSSCVNLRTGSVSSNATNTKPLTTVEDDTQLHILSDGRKRARNPHRKHKSRLENGRENLESGCLTEAAKRLKRHFPVAERTSRRVQVSDSEAETVASARLELQDSSRKKRIKPKKNQTLHNMKKQKQKQVEKSVVIRNASEINSVDSEKSGKQVNTSNSDFGFIAPSASTCGEEIVALLNGRNHELSSNRTAIAASCRSRMSPNTTSGHYNIEDKVTLDLSLNSYNDAERNVLKAVEHRGIPDLNESIIEITSAIQESQLPPVSDKRSLALDKTLDIPESHTVQSTDDNLEPWGASDDIPMEIVELLAKNQQERNNSRQHFPPNCMPSSSGRPAVSMNGCSGIINFPFSSKVTAATVADRSSGFSRGILNFPQGKYFHMEAGNPGANEFRLFNPQEPNSISGPRNSERADFLWPQRRKNLPFRLEVSQKCVTQTNGISFPSVSGKSICEMNGTDKTNGRTVLGTVSNDNIPALQLLSLTNHTTTASSILPFQVGCSSFADKPFSPAIQNTCLNPSENNMLLGSPFFSLGIHSKNLPPLLNGTPFSGESLNRCYLQAQMPGQHGCSRNDQSAERSIIPKHLPSPDEPSLQVCVLNRNPADFSIIDARNEYLITAKDLKFIKRNALKQRLPPVPKKKWTRRNFSRDQTHCNLQKQYKKYVSSGMKQCFMDVFVGER